MDHNHIDVITDCHAGKNGDIMSRDLTANGSLTLPKTRKRLDGYSSYSKDYGFDYGIDIHGSIGREASPVPNKSDTISYRSYVDSKPLKRQRSTRSTRSTTSSARRRQNEDGCVTCLRGTLHCYNVFILIVGCAALGIGIWLLVTDFGARKVTPVVGNQLYEVTTYLLIAGGGAVALLAFCGCCGTIREDKCVLSFYGTTLSIVLIVLAVACGLAFFFRGELQVKILGRMRDTLTDNYGVETRINTNNRRITDAWDAMQRQLKCCGVIGNVDSDESWNFFATKTQWSRKQKSPRRVPDSCCSPGDLKKCNGEEDFPGPPNYYNHHQEEKKKTNPYLYTDGCYDSLIDYLKTYSLVVGLVAAVVPLFLLLGIIISFSLCARVQGLGFGNDDEVDL